MNYYIIYLFEFYDYKKSSSKTSILKLYKNEDEAYEYAIRNQINYFNNNGGLFYKDKKFISNSKISYKDKYKYIFNKFNIIFGETKYNNIPTCNLYYVKNIYLSNNIDFQEDVKNLPTINNILDNDDDIYDYDENIYNYYDSE